MPSGISLGAKLGSMILVILTMTINLVQAQTVEAQPLDANINVQTFVAPTTPLQATTSTPTSSSTQTTSSSNPIVAHSSINKSTSQINTNYSSEEQPFAGCVQKLFRISGYYSPLASQKVYTRDTYQAEIRLNGRGVHGASGAPVYNGMVAAPKSYAFGTVIVIPGLGIGEVKDRGGAIISNEGYDRIDIRLGHGDDGIHLAKSVGMRRAIGRSCPENSTSTIGFNTSVIPQYADFTRVAFWSIDQSVGRSGPLVQYLQEYLTQLGYLSIDTTPQVYNEQMRQLVCRFQIDKLGLNGEEEYCGLFGPQTRTMLKKLLIASKILPSSSQIYSLSNAGSVSSLFTRPNTRPARNYQPEPTLTPPAAKSDHIEQSPLLVDTSTTSSVNLNASSTTFDRVLGLGDESDQVVVLQKILSREGVYDYKVTGYFGPITQSALAQYQLKYQLIDSLYHPAAGHLGPATRNHLNRKQIVKRIIQPLDA